MKKIFTLALSVILFMMIAPAHAATLETTCLAFEMNYTTAMAGLGYETDMTYMPGADFTMYFLTDSCAAVVNTDLLDITSIVHIGYNSNASTIDEISASMVATAMSLDPSMKSLTDTATFLANLLKMGYSTTEYCAYEFSYNSESSIYSMTIEPIY